MILKWERVLCCTMRTLAVDNIYHECWHSTGGLLCNVRFSDHLLHTSGFLANQKSFQNETFAKDVANEIYWSHTTYDAHCTYDKMKETTIWTIRSAAVECRVPIQVTCGTIIEWIQSKINSSIWGHKIAQSTIGYSSLQLILIDVIFYMDMKSKRYYYRFAFGLKWPKH